MRPMRPIAAALLAAAALSTGARAQQPCSKETLSVRGTPVTVGYCVAAAVRPVPGGEVVVPVAATFASPTAAFTRNAELRFIAGEGTSRTVQNVALDEAGLAGQTLHLTLVYAGGMVRIEGALLTPGAITVK